MTSEERRTPKGAKQEAGSEVSRIHVSTEGQGTFWSLRGMLERPVNDRRVCMFFKELLRSSQTRNLTGISLPNRVK